MFRPRRSEFAVAASLMFSGCLPGEPTATKPQPANALMRCIGESGMPPGELELAMRHLEANPPDCFATQDMDPAGPLPAPWLRYASSESMPGTESLHVNGYVMNAQCDLVKSYETEMVLYGQSPRSGAPWDGNGADGNRVPTGIYYVNTEIELPNGGKDTVYTKLGLYKFPCMP